MPVWPVLRILKFNAWFLTSGHFVCKCYFNTCNSIIPSLDVSASNHYGQYCTCLVCKQERKGIQSYFNWIYTKLSSLSIMHMHKINFHIRQLIINIWYFQTSTLYFYFFFRTVTILYWCFFVFLNFFHCLESRRRSILDQYETCITCIII